MAAQIVNSVLLELIKLSVPGAKIVELCELGDRRITEESGKCFKKEKTVKKGIAFPTAISVNNIICHYSPIEGEENDPVELNDNDLVKIDIGAHIDGYAAVVGHTFVIGASQENKVSGRKADAIVAANTAAEVALRLLKPSNENIRISEMVTKATADFNCRPIEGMQSHQMKRLYYDGEKSIVLNPTDEQKKSIDKCTIEIQDVWNIDVLVSTGDGKPREHKARTTIYKKNETLYHLKMKASRHHENDEESDVLDDVAITKYKMAAQIVNSVLLELIKLSVPGAKIVELCELGDRRITEESGKCFKKEKTVKKGIAFPTAISVNNIICHYSPIEGEENDPVELNDNDLVKIDIGAHIDGYAAVVGHTFVIGASQENKVSGRKADAIVAANTAAEVALRLLKPSNENIRISEMVTKATADFNCRPIEGMQSHQMKRLYYDGEKSIVLNPTDEQKKSIDKCTIEIQDVWNIDVLVSTGDGKPREHKARTTIYKKNETLYHLKMKASRQFYSEMADKFLAYPFNIRALEDLKKARLGITECAKHDVVQAFPVYCEKDEEFVAQFRFTVLIMPNGPMKITGLPFDPTLYQSSFKTKDAEVKEILLHSVKIQNKKKKPTKAPAQTAGDKTDQ
ncbi:unnamed protein product [Calicophoron daubneyi]|uniref:Peptidase M24 domain-containing protein n=1 Tax=Calicophoron daubneyi TaxID=300641 RepID=A0AAV2SWV9_CALDB